ncbi:MAG: serine/threonine protein kinase [Ktedonobacteraceae bacterium]|nr:serine/threonine protein kinase [Ktedonobacteraceae bacterium]MBA3824125.1 serine/threonine protein kinase [Ktedonobacterales bacterium]
MGWNDLIGTPFGDDEHTYRIEAEIARGGMSRVFRARDLGDERDIALKIMALGGDSGDGPTFTKRFEHEAHAVEMLDHPNIVKVYATGRTDEFVYIAMQLVLGGTFRQKLGRPMPIADACFQMIQMAKALHHAHMHQVIHRDVKPANMLIDDRDPSHLLLADFGIAKIMGQKGVTKTGTAVGTPEYMAPEQAKGEEIDPRADIYGLACVLYEALAGRPPFVGPTALSICYQHVHTRPAYIRGFNPEVPRALALVIEQALAKNPRDRFNTAEDFANALYPFTESDGRSSARTAITGGLDLRGTPVPEDADIAEAMALSAAEALVAANSAPSEMSMRPGEPAAMLDLSSLGTRPASVPLPQEDDATTQQTQELAPVAPLARPRHTRPVQPPSIRLKSRPITRSQEVDVATPPTGYGIADVAHLSTVQSPVTPRANARVMAPPPTGPTKATRILESTSQPSRIRLIIVILAALLIGIVTLWLIAHARGNALPASTGVVATTQPTLPAMTPSPLVTTQPTAQTTPQITVTPAPPTAPPVNASAIITAASITLVPDASCSATNNHATITPNTKFYVNACEQPGHGQAEIQAVVNTASGSFNQEVRVYDPSGTGGGFPISIRPLAAGNYIISVKWKSTLAQTLQLTVK